MVKKPLLLLDRNIRRFVSRRPFSSNTEPQIMTKGTSLAYLIVDLLRTCNIKISPEQAVSLTHASIDLAPGSLAKGMFSFFAGQYKSIQCWRI